MVSGLVPSMKAECKVMRKIAAVAVTLSLSAAGQAFAGPPHAPTAHPEVHAGASASRPEKPNGTGFFIQSGNGVLPYERNGQYVASQPHGTSGAGDPAKVRE
jgi:hypothetical protein